MSVKAMALVWDMLCPETYGDLQFKPNHKYVLVAYADHADHNGKNIFPAIATVARKTGYGERNVQYLTGELEEMGILIEDGVGPRGTNKWKIPYDERGAKIAPVQSPGGAKNGDSSGAKSSGAKFAPELTEQDIYISNPDLEFIVKAAKTFLDENTHKGREVLQELLACHSERLDKAILITGLGIARAQYYESRYKRHFERALVGILNEQVEVSFCE